MINKHHSINPSSTFVISGSDTMRSRWFFSSVFMLLLNKVASQDQTVEAVEGRTVTLQCSYNGTLPKREEVKVFWRDNDQNSVYNIINGKEVDGDPKYKNRTQSFPDFYEKGNFSIKLSDVRKSDEGTYSCEMISAKETQKVQLRVTDPTPAPTSTPAPKSSSKTQESRSAEVLMIFTVLLGFSLIQV